jgi:hypothetical protein
VEQRLREAPVDALTPSARFSRARLLDELHDYWQAGVFPRNTGHAGERRPYFIDDEGRACAVGALVIRSGHAELAARVDRNFHTDYVPDMPDAELLAWAATHGFSVAELALIQPTYCNCDGSQGAAGASGAGGVGGAGDADYYQPVCGSNGLTYWNQCIAELCGGVTVVAAGQCAVEPPCELCGTGSREVIVSECGEPGEGSEGICNGIDSQPSLARVNEGVALRWLELQAGGCSEPNYEFPGDFVQWQPSLPVNETWRCRRCRRVCDRPRWRGRRTSVERRCTSGRRLTAAWRSRRSGRRARQGIPRRRGIGGWLWLSDSAVQARNRCIAVPDPDRLGRDPAKASKQLARLRLNRA